MTAGPGDAGLSLTAAAQRIAEAVAPVVDHERVALKDALDRVLAEDIVASGPVPAHDNAAMDGYAVHADDAGAAGAPRVLRVVGEARAGRPFVGRVGRDECVRILTGAVMPADCDAVVQQERVALERREGGVFVVVVEPTKIGQHRRLAGEDLRRGAVVLARGRRALPADLGLAASVGASTLVVVRRLRVAVFSTGDELRDVDEALAPGCIRDSNRYTLIGMLTRIGADVRDLGIVRDDPDALEATLIRACRGDGDVAADAIVTSGGVSAGDADHTRAVMDRLGDVAFWKLAMKPGRPMAFGRVTAAGRTVPLFGLPGNPVAVMVVFYALVRDALLAMSGLRPSPLPAVTAIATEPLAKAAGRTEFFRGIATCHDGSWTVGTTGPQGSGILRSMSDANCLIVLDHERGPVAVGEPVAVWLFHGLA